MLSKWSKKSDESDVGSVEEPAMETKKSRVKSADIVFGVGILLILAGIIYMVRQAYIPQSSTNTSTIAKTTAVPVEHNVSTPPPYSAYVEKNKPWEEGKQKAKKIRQNLEQTMLSKTEKTDKPQPTSKPQVVPVAVSHKVSSFVCTVLDKFKHFENREMLYYRVVVTKGHVDYIPAFNQQTWDEKGITLKHHFMVNSVDVKNSMAEIEPNKWIPALAFSKCTLAEDN